MLPHLVDVAAWLLSVSRDAHGKCMVSRDRPGPQDRGRGGGASVHDLCHEGGGGESTVTDTERMTHAKGSERHGAGTC